MAVRCPECGYENRPQYRFCGRCGASLPAETLEQGEERNPPAPREKIAPPPRDVVAPPREKTVTPQKKITPLSGPSFLGLDKDPERGAEYLLEEDEPGQGHGRMYVALLLLVIAAGLLGWQWKRGALPVAQLLNSWTSERKTSTPPLPPAPVSPPTDASETASAAPQQQVPGESQPAPSEGQKATTDPSSTEPASSATGAGSASAPAAPDKAAPVASPTGPADSTPPSAAPAAGTPVAAVTKPPKKQPEPTPKSTTKPAISGSGDAALVVQGERYLYGTSGVAQNCDMAQRSLLAAAAHSNTKAFTTLGTMYATGHCAGHDLPTAYRWFAKALRQEPGNARASQNLELLWKQMTPAERQAATRSGQ